MGSQRTEHNLANEQQTTNQVKLELYSQPSVVTATFRDSINPDLAYLKPLQKVPKAELEFAAFGHRFIQHLHCVYYY